MNTVTRKPFIIDRQVTKTCIAIQTCCGEAAEGESAVFLRLRKAGCCNHEIEYPMTQEGENLCVEWDDLMYELKGRYIGDIYEGSDLIASIQFDVNPKCYVAAHIKEDKADDNLPECDPPKCD